MVGGENTMLLGTTATEGKLSLPTACKKTEHWCAHAGPLAGPQALHSHPTFLFDHLFLQ